MEPLWIDTDLALGAPRGDVDDGFALAALLAARHPLLGVSAVAGNVDATAAHAAAGALLACFPDRAAALPLVAQREAPSHLAALPAGSSLLALGPLTSVAAALRRAPELPRRCSLRLVATVHRPWRAPLLPLFDLNRRRDRGALRAVLTAPWRERRIFPLDVVRRLRLGAGDLERLAQTGQAGAHLARHARRWLRRAPLRYGARRFPAWDLVAALDALGQLPAARFAAGRLVAFDPEAARERFHQLLGNLSTSPRGRVVDAFSPDARRATEA